MPQLRLAPGASADTVQWPNLGYADAYAESYELFARPAGRRDDPGGRAPPDAVPDPAGVDGGDDRARGPAGRRCCRMSSRAVRRSRPGARGDPPRPLRGPVGRRGRVRPTRRRIRARVRGADGAGRCPACSRVRGPVPDDVPVGMHLCYGDYGHQHFMQPESLATQVGLVNAWQPAPGGPSTAFSFTVPQATRRRGVLRPTRRPPDRARDRAVLRARPLPPRRPGAGHDDGTGEHIDAALAESTSGPRDWGICTECGMGRVEAGRRAEAARPAPRDPEGPTPAGLVGDAQAPAAVDHDLLPGDVLRRGRRRGTGRAP